MINFKYNQLMVFTFMMLFSFHVLLLYAISGILLFVLSAIVAIFSAKIGWRNAVMFIASIMITTLFVTAFIKLSGLNHSIYYRPQEMFSIYDSARNQYHYESNINFQMMIPHGDLKAFNQDVLSEPRHVLFQTDSDGYRNAKDFHGQKYVLVGDSFVAGNGISQENLITEQLKHYGIDSYSLATPGRLSDYVHYITNFEKKYGKQYKFILFLYEGNDFGKAHAKPPPHFSKFEEMMQYVEVRLDRYKKIWGIENTDIYRLISTYIQRVSYDGAGKSDEVDIQEVNKVSMAFYKPYVSVVKRRDLPEHLNFEKVIAPIRSRVAHIFFIPAKYRVYYKHLYPLASRDAEALPDQQWEYVLSLGLKLGISTTDLTPALIKASDVLLVNNRLTYWRGDTHWNKYGIAAAAKVVLEQLSGTHEISLP